MDTSNTTLKRPVDISTIPEVGKNRKQSRNSIFNPSPTLTSLNNQNLNFTTTTNNISSNVNSIKNENNSINSKEKLILSTNNIAEAYPNTDNNNTNRALTKNILEDINETLKHQKRNNRKRRSTNTLLEHEKWNCIFKCGKFYRATSTRSILAHIQKCPRRPERQELEIL